jgi:hypothetical protein
MQADHRGAAIMRKQEHIDLLKRVRRDPGG